MTQLAGPPRLRVPVPAGGGRVPEPAGGEMSGPPSRPRWGRWAQMAVVGLAAAVYLSNLSVNGLANPYYAAAVKSGSVSWKAFLFGSLDPGSFITVDKPPAAFWVQAISVRLFGYSSWSLLVPEAVAGVVSVAVVYHLARRFAGEAAGVLAGVALALTPMAAAMFRFNDPDALMTLVVVLAAWAVGAATERASPGHLIVGGLLLGLAFDAKMLEAFVVVPGLALAWIVAAPTSWRRRLWGWLWSGLALIASAGWWVALVELWPSDSRPYIGSTSDNSLLSLIFGYNGLSRLFGGDGGSLGSRGGFAFGSEAGWGRVFGDSLGSQVSWLVPLAALGLAGGLLLAGRAPLSDRRRAGFVLWGGWGLTAFVVFSRSKGTFHPYYTVAMAPAVAVLAGAGAGALWELGRTRRWLAWVLPAGVGGSALWAWFLLDRDPGYHPWLRMAIVVGGGVGAVGLLAGLAAPGARHATRIGQAAIGLSTLALMAGPGAWTLSTLTHATSGGNPTGGPLSAATGGFGGGSGFGFGGSFGGGFGGGFAGGSGRTPGPSVGDRRLVAFLEAHQGDAKYLLATDGSMSADELIIASGRPVMAMGGFIGADPDPTLAQFEKLVARGQVRYVLIGGGGLGGRPGSGKIFEILGWVQSHGHFVPASDYGSGVSGSLWEITPAAAA